MHAMSSLFHGNADTGQSPAKGVIARMSVDRCHKSSPGPGAKAIGSGTRIDDHHKKNIYDCDVDLP